MHEAAVNYNFAAAVAWRMAGAGPGSSADGATSTTLSDFM
jgi:hypothetical protein